MAVRGTQHPWDSPSQGNQACSIADAALTWLLISNNATGTWGNFSDSSTAIHTLASETLHV